MQMTLKMHARIHAFTHTLISRSIEKIGGREAATSSPGRDVARASASYFGIYRADASKIVE
jgi:hypothetical protein